MTPLDVYLLLAAGSHFQADGIEVFVQKVLYCAEDDAVREGSNPFPTFPFYRWTHGPYSKEVANTYKEMAGRGFFRAKGGILTERGRRLVEEMRQEIRRFPVAAAALSKVDEYARRFRFMRTQEMLREVYARPAEGPFGGVITVEQVVERTPMISRDLSADVTREHEELFGLIAWRLSQTPEDEQAEREARRIPEPDASQILSRYLD